VLDSSVGKPAQGVKVELSQINGTQAQVLATGSTDSDGRVTTLLNPTTQLQAGVYKMRFEVGDYFQSQNVQAFYPYVEITFNLANPGQHYHIPLLLAPFSYSTYRGS
ncbi:hydroxyisourate hydrolase, partial [Cutaneotrichosporon oleaginosum]